MPLNQTSTNIEFIPVPPPSKAQIQSKADELGLVNGLRVEKSRDSYRCACCGEMQVLAEYMVWVPDSVQKGDSPEAIEELCRKNAFTGTGSGWCLKCAPKKKIVKACNTPTSETHNPHTRLDTLMLAFSAFIAGVIFACVVAGAI